MKRLLIRQSGNETLKPEVEEADSLLTTSEVSTLLQIHVSTVRKWSSLGIFESCGRGPRGEKLFQKKGVIESMLIFKPNSLPSGLL